MTTPGSEPAGELKSATRARQLQLWLMVIGLFALLFLAFAEIAVRVAAPQPQTWFNIYRPHPGIASYHLLPDLDVVQISGQPFRVITDSAGHRIGAAELPPPARGAVWFAGDSYTFAQGVDWEHSFVGLFAVRHRGELGAVNLGVGGWGPRQYLADLEYELGQGKRPRALVVTSYLGNDFFDCIWNKNPPIRDGVLNDPGGFKSLVKRNSHLYRAVSAIYHRYAPVRDEVTETAAIMAVPGNWQGPELVRAEQLYADAFRGIAATARSAGIPLLVVLAPTRESVLQEASGGTIDGSDHRLAAQHAGAIMRSLGIEYIDLTDTLAASGAAATYLPLDGHFNPKGHAVAADAVDRWVARLDLE